MAVSKTRVVKRDGTTKEYPVLPVTIVAFERQFNCSLGDVNKMEHVYWLAWHCEKSSGAVVKLFDDWLADVEDVEEVKDTEDAASFPTAAAPSPSSSPESQ